MAGHGWAHDVAGDPVHFDHLASADIRGKDTLAFQRLWNRNHPGDKIAEDGAYGPQTEARLVQSPATGFAVGASCTPAARIASAVAIDGPDRIAPGSKAHYRITLHNTGDTEWPATATLVVAGGASELYDAATWTSTTEIGAIGAAIPAGAQGTVDLDIVAPHVATSTAIAAQLAVIDQATQLGSIDFAVTVTPDGDDNTSADSGDQVDGEISGGCSAGGAAGWFALAPVLMMLRRRRGSR
jgi:Synergist-CTERM protein sorting domain-containing protein